MCKFCVSWVYYKMKSATFNTLRGLTISRILIGVVFVIPACQSDSKKWSISHCITALHVVSAEAFLFGLKKVWIFFLFLNESMCCGYTLKAP